MDEPIARALVVGAGVAGIRAALDLAESGHEVLLTDRSPAIGGILSKLDVQFPSDHCGMCRMLPFVGRENASQFCMRKSLYHDNITILPDTEVVGCEGEPGAFAVRLKHRARWVDTELCIGDGACADVCPIEVPDEFNEGLTRRKAIFRPVPQNLPNLYVIDRDVCTRCGECLSVCPTGAIDLNAEDREEEVTVGAVVLAIGAGLYDPAEEPNFYGFGRSPHVLTSLGFERSVSENGTYSGPLLRPADGKEVKRIAWLSCVGSRNRRLGRDHCSSVCCMFALKEAVLAKEHGGPDTDAVFFYMDLRSFGRDYYRYQSAAEEKGVRLVRCRSHAVFSDGAGDPLIRYFDAEGQAHEEAFDLVVLAAGQDATKEMAELAGTFGVEVEGNGFVRTDGTHRVRTSRPGIYACGSFTGLKDINETLIEGSAAACEAGQLLRSKGLTPRPAAPSREERAVDRELPAVSVLLCRWPQTEGEHGIDFDRLADEVRSVRDVVEVRVLDEACRKGLDEMKAGLASTSANRVVIAACLPYVYKQGLRTAALAAGFNSALVEVIDLRGAVRRAVRSGNGVDPLAEALSLVRGNVEALAVRDPVHATRCPVEHRALVVGGGPAGMQAALSLARHGSEVVLVERADRLGGHALELRTTLEGLDPRRLVQSMAEEVRSQSGIRVLTGAEVVASNGRAGSYRSRIRVADEEELVEVRHGATIVATGGVEAGTDLYGHGRSDAVMTQGELERALADGALDPSSLRQVVMIQCVGSRDADGRAYCSRVCCSAALKNAFSLLERNADLRLLVLYRDIMTYGFKERYYTEARARGVLFSSYDPDRKPEVDLEDGKPVVRYRDEVLGDELEIRPDLLVLSTGMVPTNGSDLPGLLGLNLTADGFLEEADYKFRPVETLKEGVYVCGLSHSPRSIPESLAMAEAAAMRALTVLSRNELVSARLVSRVREAYCATCEICVGLCPYEARTVEDGRVVVDELACQGCGICVAACPSGAATFAGLAERQVMATLDAQLGSALEL
jgi:heterodisulfide reductase subunit A